MSDFKVITKPLPQEVIKLGLGDTPFLIPHEQVKTRFGVDDNGTPKIVIYVQDIDLLGIDPGTKNARYRITGIRQFVQNWDMGGSYLDPKVFVQDTDA